MRSCVTSVVLRRRAVTLRVVVFFGVDVVSVVLRGIDCPLSSGSLAAPVRRRAQGSCDASSRPAAVCPLELGTRLRPDRPLTAGAVDQLDAVVVRFPARRA
jgi:hypothetical protein